MKMGKTAGRRFDCPLLIVIFLVAGVFVSSLQGKEKYSKLIYPGDLEQASSSSVAAGNKPGFSFDKNMGTRWESEQNAEPQWIIYKFKKPKILEELVVNWETAAALAYDVETSMDGQEWHLVAFVNNGTQNEKRSIKFRSITARYLKIFCKTRASEWGYSLWEVEFNPSASAEDTEKLSIVKATVSSEGPNSNGPESLFDGNLLTRWESTHGVDKAWVVLQLDSRRDVSGIRIVWETASAEKYDIECSNDGTTWKKVAGVTDGKQGEDKVINFSDAVNAQYIRINCLAPSTEYGYSIYETSVF
jgi:hypothetical protein